MGNLHHHDNDHNAIVFPEGWPAVTWAGCIDDLYPRPADDFNTDKHDQWIATCSFSGIDIRDQILYRKAATPIVLAALRQSRSENPEVWPVTQEVRGAKVARAAVKLLKRYASGAARAQADGI